MAVNRWQSFLLRTAHRLTGSAVKVRAEKAAKIPARVKWPTDANLERRQCLARETLRAAGIEPKALR